MNLSAASSIQKTSCISLLICSLVWFLCFDFLFCLIFLCIPSPQKAKHDVQKAVYIKKQQSNIPKPQSCAPL